MRKDTIKVVAEHCSEDISTFYNRMPPYVAEDIWGTKDNWEKLVALLGAVNLMAIIKLFEKEKIVLKRRN